MRSNLKLFDGARPDNINAKDNEGKTPLHYLAETKFLDDAEMERTTKSYESQFNQDYHQVLPRLSLERIKGSLNSILDKNIREFVTHEADINARDNAGRTALQNCDLMKGKQQAEEAKKVLLHCGAAINALDDKANDAEEIFADSIACLESGREFRNEQAQLKKSLTRILNAAEMHSQEKSDMAKHIGSYLRERLPQAKIDRTIKEKMSDLWQKLAHKFVKETSRDKSHNMIATLIQEGENHGHSTPLLRGSKNPKLPER